MAQRLDRLAAALATVRATDPTLPIQDLAAFLYIVQHPGCSHGDLTHPLDLNLPQVSNIVSRIGDGWLTKPGLKWVHSETDPANKKKRQIFVAPAGQRLVSKLETALT